MKHIIVLPNPHAAHFIHPSVQTRDWRTYQYSNVLNTLQDHRDIDVEVITDNDNKLSQRVPMRKKFGSDIGRYANFFTLDNELFMIHVGDLIQEFTSDLLIHYASKGVRAIFILQRRTCFEYIFDNSPIPIFSMGSSSDSLAYNLRREQIMHSKSMNSVKKTSVFFSGSARFRRHLSSRIRSSISDTVITPLEKPSEYGRIFDKSPTAFLSPDEYFEKMCQSKIVWCPHTAPRGSDDCHLVTSREFEAMCLEILVVKPKPGIIEPEPRIAGVHYVEVEDHNLVDKIQYYLDHDDERKEIAHNGRLWFERNSSVHARAKHLFECSLNTIRNG